MERIFVGRERELAAIDGALEACLGGRGQLVLLAGEPGIGKTRLADEASAVAKQRGFTVRWGRSWEAGGAPAYWPWLDVLTGLARTLDDGLSKVVVSDGASLLAELVPELRGRLSSAHTVATPPPEEARFRLWRAIRALLEAASEQDPLFIVLDDLHAADVSSLGLLLFVARQLRPLRVVLLGTYRDVEARMNAETSELISRVGREGTVLSLRRLDRGTAAGVIERQSGKIDPAVLARILDSSQGNPLFLEEMLRLCDEAGPASIAAGAVPHGVRDVIRQRLGKLSADARSVLDSAAVVGDEIDSPLLAAVAGRDVSWLMAQIAEATRAGVLTHVGDLLGHVPEGERTAARSIRRPRFAHALFREVLYRELPEETRRDLHGRLASVLERLSAPEASAAPRYAELAHHAMNGPHAMLPRAVDYAAHAAAEAQQLLAYDEAVDVLERAARAVELAGNPPALRAPLLVALGDACIRAGDTAQGKVYCREAATIARATGDGALGARAALTYGRVFNFGAVDPVLVGMLEESLEALPTGGSVLRARLLARLGAALQPSPNAEEPIAIAREAIATARRLDDDVALLETLHDGIAALMNIAPPDEVRALNLEAERLALKLGDRERLLRTHARLAVTHLALGELDAADTRIADFEALAHELRAPWIAWRGHQLRAVRAAMQGRFADAERLAAEALRVGHEGKDPLAEQVCTTLRAGVLRAAERHEEMLSFEPNVHRVWANFADAPAWQAASAALVHARLEEIETTRLYVDLLPDFFRPPVANVFPLFFVAESVALAGSTELAGHVYDEIQRLPDRFVMLGLSYMSWEGPRSRLLANLAVQRGRWEQAFAHFDDAIADCRRLDARPHLARTLYECGRARLRQSKADDLTPAARHQLQETARTLITEARAIASDLGMSGLIRLVDRIDRSAVQSEPAETRDTTVPASAASSGFSIVSEGEYWTVTHGRSTFRLKDSIGLRYLTRLLAEPGREIHVLDLTGAGDRTTPPSDTMAAIDVGDAGEVLDAQARAEYRRRMDDLDDVLAEAESFGDTTRATRAREERELLIGELGRATGLGGRSRRAAGATERARSAVQRRIKNALDRIKEHAPDLAADLGRSIKTGIFCVYRPR